MKLSSGVSVKQELSKMPRGSIQINSNNTRKKLQFLKNNELDPVKIKLSELMSYKRLGTANHLAYCSSMKTVHSIK